jgi:lipopolysaccharide transport system ATP-binding protein
MDKSVSIRVNKLGKRFPRRRLDATFGMRQMVDSAIRLPFTIGRSLFSAQTVKGDDGYWALRDVSFEIRRGSLVGLVGPNGAGKSILLKILSRVTLPSEGSVELRGRVGAVLEAGAAFHPNLTGRENLRLSAALAGISERVIRQQFDSIVRFAGVEERLDVPVKRWSNGTIARLAFSVLYHLDYDILLIDEILAMSDESFREKSSKTLRALANKGRTVIFVSHDAALLPRITDHCLHLDGGRLTDHGPTSELLERHKLRAVAR